MAAFYYGYPLLIENNKYGIARILRVSVGTTDYLLDRPSQFLSSDKRSKVKVKNKGCPI